MVNSNQSTATSSETVVGVDTGGTFTDFVFLDASGGMRVDKRPSDPSDPARPVLEGLAGHPEAQISRLVHGTTVATNALLEGKLGPTALLTTAGCEDVLEIGRQHRPELYALHPARPAPVIPRDLRFGVHERVRHDGSVERVLDPEETRRVLAHIRDAGVTSVAVCLLHSYANPAHEELIGDLAEEAGLSVSLSSRVLPEFREYERMSTVSVNAALRPIMSGYLERLGRDARARTFTVMQSGGGVISARMAAVLPVHTVLSGPAGGVIAAALTAKQLGLTRIITFDMGGTSTDVSLYDGGPTLSTAKVIAGHPIRVPMIDVHTVGAGGGSIAYRDLGGALKVGPMSAGADPGPVCYGLGSAVTVTDANLYLGRLDPSFLLGGRMTVFPERVNEPLEALARSLGLDAVRTGEGIVTVVNAVMERAVRVISVARGYDPREFTLVSFGGAGGLHALELARALGIPQVVIPPDAGVFSAYGMALADVVRDYSRTYVKRLDRLEEGEIGEALAALGDMGRAELEEEGVSPERVVVERSVDVRYEGQSYEITVPLAPDLLTAFQAAHERAYGYALEGTRVELVTLRVRLAARTEKVGPEARNESGGCEKASCGTTRPVFYRGGWVSAQVYGREALGPARRVEGPAIIGESSSTVFLGPGDRCEKDGWGNLKVVVG